MASCSLLNIASEKTSKQNGAVMEQQDVIEIQEHAVLMPSSLNIPENLKKNTQNPRCNSPAPHVPLAEQGRNFCEQFWFQAPCSSQFPFCSAALKNKQGGTLSPPLLRGMASSYIFSLSLSFFFVCFSFFFSRTIFFFLFPLLTSC